MKQASFQRLKSRLRKGDLSVYRELLTTHGKPVMDKLQIQSGCSLGVAEQVWIDGLLRFREKILSGHIQQIQHLRTQLYKSCTEAMRLEQTTMFLQDDSSIKQFFFKLARKQYTRDIQEDISQLPASYFADLTRAAQKISYALPEEAKYILFQYYVHKQSLADIAQSLGVSEQMLTALKSEYYNTFMEGIRSEMKAALSQF